MPLSLLERGPGLAPSGHLPDGQYFRQSIPGHGAGLCEVQGLGSVGGHTKVLHLRHDRILGHLCDGCE